MWDVTRRLGQVTGHATNRLAELLGGQTPVLLDGGMGTLLQDLGLEGGGAGELWNVERPDAIREVHEAYAEAGARILTTNTFGGTRPRLQMHGLEDRVHELNEAAATIARSVADAHGILVAGDLGPTGELMAPLGTMDADQATAYFVEELEGLAAGGIDVVVIETMSDLAEVEAAMAAARTVVPELPVIATMSFDTNLRTMMGVRPADAVVQLAAAGADAVGANCGRGPEDMAAIAADLAHARPDGLLLVAQSNAGLPHVVGDHFEYDAPPDEMATHAAALDGLGIDLIGSCCGSTPAHTRAMRDALSAERALR
jgi:5-methyltetrahydrofolate--homocysteine methyltransferase